jgi:hypothetical protein
VTTFLSTVSRYQANVIHISGAANLATDFASRNPLECNNADCQVCTFVHETQDSAVRSISVKDVTDGLVSMPFIRHTAWHATQQECPDLRRTHSHLTQGTRPSKKMTNLPDVKCYLQSVVIARDGVLIVKLEQAFHPVRERIVVPRSVLHGLLTAIHLRFNHPTMYQMKQLVTRYFFALDLDKSIQSVVTNCHHCLSLKTIPTCLHP